MGKSTIQGEGAGASATTSALISDISSILRGNIKFPFSISNKERKNLFLKIYQKDHSLLILDLKLRINQAYYQILHVFFQKMTFQ